MSHPTCATDCINLLDEEDPCSSQDSVSARVKCYCTSESYITGFKSCVNLYCDAADISAWAAYGDNNCAVVGITLSSTSTVTATSASGPQSTSATYQTLVVTGAGFPDATTTGSSTSTSSAQPASASTIYNSKNGLGVGAIAGIAVGAAVIMLIAALIAVLLWRRKTKQPRALPPESGPVQEVGSNSSEPDAGSDPKPMPTSNVVFKPEPHVEQATHAINYGGQPFIQKSSNDGQYPSQQLAPMLQSSVHQVSPSSARSESVGAVPSGVDATTLAPYEYGLPYHYGYVEAGSAHQSHITSSISGLGTNPYQNHHELSISPQLTQNSTGTGVSALEIRKIPSSSALQPTAPILESHVAAATGERVAEHVDGDAEDAELDRMKSEIEAIRVEKERVLHLQALEERERELSRRIVNRELARGTGS